MKNELKQLGIGTVVMLSLFTTKTYAQNGAAGERGGNGGDAIVCPGTVRLLDVVEGEGRKFALSLTGGTVTEKVRAAVNDVMKVDYFRAKLLRDYSEELLADLSAHEADPTQELKNIMFTKGTLPDVDDSFELIIPENCHKEQLVTQRAPGMEYGVSQRYAIQENLWDLLDDDNRAMTILHESWYRLAIEKGATDSRFIRLMNEYTTSTKFAEEGREGYIKIFTEYSEKLRSSLRLSVTLDQPKVATHPPGTEWESGLKNFAKERYWLKDGVLDYEIVEADFNLSTYRADETGFSYVTKRTTSSKGGLRIDHYPYVIKMFFSDKNLKKFEVYKADFDEKGVLKSVTYFDPDSYVYSYRLVTKSGFIKVSNFAFVIENESTVIFKDQGHSIKVKQNGKIYRGLSYLEVDKEGNIIRMKNKKGKEVNL